MNKNTYTTHHDSQRVLDARKRLVEAFHAMHVDQRISVSVELARQLDSAWQNYDRAIVAQWRQQHDNGQPKGPIF